MSGITGLMSHREYVLVGIVRTANCRLMELGCPLNGLATVRPAKNRSTDWNMWANVREGALLRLASIRDRPARQGL
jgi:hypothetical protein